MGIVSPGALRVSRDRALVWVFGVALNGQATWWAVVIGYERCVGRSGRTGRRAIRSSSARARLSRCRHRRLSSFGWLG